MNCIAAVASDWGIGKNNDLLFHIPEDLKYFRRMTAGGTLVLGRKNLESFPGCRPLPKRRHLVLTRKGDWRPEGVEIFHAVPDLLSALRDIPGEEIWVVGGGEIYREFLPYCERAYITHVDAAPPADIFFPDLTQEPGWTLLEQGDELKDGDLPFRFCVYKNSNPKKI